LIHAFCFWSNDNDAIPVAADGLAGCFSLPQYLYLLRINPDNLMIMVLAAQYMMNRKYGTEMVNVLKKKPCGVVERV